MWCRTGRRVTLLVFMGIGYTATTELLLLLTEKNLTQMMFLKEEFPVSPEQHSLSISRCLLFHLVQFDTHGQAREESRVPFWLSPSINRMVRINSRLQVTEHSSFFHLSCWLSTLPSLSKSPCGSGSSEVKRTWNNQHFHLNFTQCSGVCRPLSEVNKMKYPLSESTSLSRLKVPITTFHQCGITEAAESLCCWAGVKHTTHTAFKRTRTFQITDKIQRSSLQAQHDVETYC